MIAQVFLLNEPFPQTLSIVLNMQLCLLENDRVDQPKQREKWVGNTSTVGRVIYPKRLTFSPLRCFKNKESES